jgi:hypothetical protein
VQFLLEVSELDINWGLGNEAGELDINWGPGPGRKVLRVVGNIRFEVAH